MPKRQGIQISGKQNEYWASIRFSNKMLNESRRSLNNSVGRRSNLKNPNYSKLNQSELEMTQTNVAAEDDGAVFSTGKRG